jgi:hypothetical protein
MVATNRALQLEQRRKWFDAIGSISIVVLTIGLLSIAALYMAWRSFARKDIAPRKPPQSLSLTATVLASIGVAWLALIVIGFHMYFDHALATGCSGGGCGGFPESGWANTRELLIELSAVNLVAYLIVSAARWGAFRAVDWGERRARARS